MTDQKPKIFLSYAHEDIGMAKRIYQDLKRYGLDIWFDNESLLGGQNWKFEINNAIKKSTYFLAILSTESIDSIGYVQKELKIALEMLDLYPKNKTYILPVRIEDCEPIEERLRDLHWIDVFPETEYQNGLKKILQVVKEDAHLLRKTPMLLSDTNVREILLRYGFYDSNKNPEGKGFSHQYKLQEINGNKVVFDEVTGLMWQQSGSDNEMGYYGDENKNWIKELNKNRFAGFNDWRLPTLEEAMSLMKPEKKNERYTNPIFDSKQECIWTADQYKTKGHLRPWIVGFDAGICYYGNPLKIIGYYVRAVRST